MNQFETNNVNIPPEWESNPTLRNMGRFYREAHTPDRDETGNGLIPTALAVIAIYGGLALCLNWATQAPTMDQPPYSYTIEKSQRLEDVTGGYLSPDKFTKPKGQTNQ